MNQSAARSLAFECDNKIESIRTAAMTLRSEIFSMDKTKVPKPTTIHTVKASSQEIPVMTQLFFNTLISGLDTQPKDVPQRKTTSLASDAVFPQQEVPSGR